MARPTAVVGITADTPRQTGLRRLIFGRLGDLLRFLGRLHALMDPRSPRGNGDEVALVHDARVAARRLKAALSLYPFGPKARRKAALDKVRKLCQGLGEIRDRDVLLAYLTSEGLCAEPMHRPALSLLISQVVADREERVPLFARQIEFFLEEGVTEIGRSALCLSAKGRMGGRRLLTKLRRQKKKVLRRLSVIQTEAKPDAKPDAKTDAESLHNLRIALKKLRYQAELLLDLVPSVTLLLKALEKAQEVLGTLHDIDERLVFLAGARASQEAREDGIPLDQAESQGIAWLIQRQEQERLACLSKAYPILLGLSL